MKKRKPGNYVLFVKYVSMNYVCSQNGSCNSSLFYGNYNRIHVISERLVENAYFFN